MKLSGKPTGILIVCFWLVLMGLLVKKTLLVDSGVFHEPGYLDETLESREEWAGLYLKGQKVGYAFSEIRRLEEGYRMTETLFMNVTVMGLPQKIESRINAIIDRNMALENFSFRIRSGAVSFIAYGSIENSLLQLKIVTGGKKKTQEIKLKEQPVLAGSLKYCLLKRGLKVGTVFSRQIFDPLTLANRAVRVEVVARELLPLRGESVDSFKIKEVFNGIELYSWVDIRGETLKEESPMGIVLLREPRELALRMSGGEDVDLIAETAIKLDGHIRLKGLSYLKLRLKNISIDDFDLNSERQVQNGDVVEIRLESLSGENTFRLPCKNPEMRRYLEATAFMQSDDEQIRSAAAEIIGSETDARKAADRIYKWVYKNIEKKPTLSIPSALAVLKTRQGDCNEHAVLFTALCRSAGIPARVCAGIVFVNNGFYYHAWAEIFLGKWVSIDPTLEQFPADVTHIKFFEGGMEDQLGVLTLVGRLELEVLAQK